VIGEQILDPLCHIQQLSARLRGIEACQTRIHNELEPRWNPGTRKVVGAAGFELASPAPKGVLVGKRGTPIYAAAQQNSK